MARARHAKVVPSADHLREQRLGKVLAAGPDGADAEAALAALARLIADKFGEE